jgi:adenylate cyclase
MAFADGVTEDIITTLSHADTLLVIARNSCFSYKGRVVDVKDVGRELVVRYVLTGSVRRAGDRVRIAAHLAETENGVHIWADRYDRTMTDVFAVQDDIAASVSQVILPMVAVAERRRAATRDPTMPDAWESYQRALAHWAAQDSAAALVTLRRTLALDDGFAPAHAVMADVMISIGHRGLIPWREASEVGDYHARRAIALDPDLPDGHALLSRSALMRGDPESALIHAETAVALGPNSVNALIARGQVLVSLGRHEAGRRDLRLARRLNPMDPATRIVDMVIGSSLFLNGEFEESAAHLRGLVLAYPRYSAAHFWLLAALGRRGVHDEARRVMERLHELAPRLLGMFADGHHRWYRPEDHAAVMQGFRAAGWRG